MKRRKPLLEAVYVIQIKGEVLCWYAIVDKKFFNCSEHKGKMCVHAGVQIYSKQKW